MPFCIASKLSRFAIVLLFTMNLGYNARGENDETIRTRPNIVLFLTDDQDLLLGGGLPLPEGQNGTPLKKTRELIAEKGLTAKNFFVHTPICCPSRSELLTGRYFHNIKTNHLATLSNDIDCMHVNESLVNDLTFARALQVSGYAVGLFGKYLNKMPQKPPKGFDTWFANDGGTYTNPLFFVKNAPGLVDGETRIEGYSTSIIGNMTIEWIKTVANRQPFFAYVAPKAAHEPFIPAPWYLNYWEEDWPQHEPRPPNYNCSIEYRADHHGVIALQDMISEEAGKVVTSVFKNRWRTLLSVDDMVADIVEITQELNVYNNTYFIFTSDHGFQLGQFNILMDKRHVYDWDTRVPFLISGPGIPSGKEFYELTTQVDLAPTILDLAGVRTELEFDGRSMLPLWFEQIDNLFIPIEVKRSLESYEYTIDECKGNWRDTVFIEYYFNTENTKCVHGCNPEWDKNDFNGDADPARDYSCGNLTTKEVCWCLPENPGKPTGCYPTEGHMNNYIAVRTINKSTNTLYAEFMTGDKKTEEIDFSRIDFIEYYDLDKDPWMLNNNYATIKAEKLKELHEQVHFWFKCKGTTCP